jgi:hypothetical protein
MPIVRQDAGERVREDCSCILEPQAIFLQVGLRVCEKTLFSPASQKIAIDKSVTYGDGFFRLPVFSQPLSLSRMPVERQAHRLSPHPAGTRRSSAKGGR